MIEETGRAASAASVVGGGDAEDEDEALAEAARVRYRKDGIARIEPDDGMRSTLGSEEHLLALRDTASIVRRPLGDSLPLSGRLAITNVRLFVVDTPSTTLASLEELDDVTLVADRLLVSLTSETGFTIETSHPRLLRVQLAAARAERLDSQMVASSNMPGAMSSDLPRR